MQAEETSPHRHFPVDIQACFPLRTQHTTSSQGFVAEYSSAKLQAFIKPLSALTNPTDRSLSDQYKLTYIFRPFFFNPSITQ